MLPELRLKRIAATEKAGLWCNWQLYGLRAPTRSVGRRVGEGSTPFGPIATHRRVAQG